MQLTSTDQYVINNARAIAAARTNEDMRAALTGNSFAGCDDQDTLTYACLGQASSDLEYLCDLVEKLAAALAAKDTAGV